MKFDAIERGEVHPFAMVLAKVILSEIKVNHQTLLEYRKAQKGYRIGRKTNREGKG